MDSESIFDRLVEEGDIEPVNGWDFSWFRGRATEVRPSWNYFERLSERVQRANAVLDIETGGGERFAEVLRSLPSLPKRLAATESWVPNVDIARRELGPLGVTVRETADGDRLPFDDESFDLVCSRHPTSTPWFEIARVLEFGGTFISQQIGAGTNRELTDFMMGPQPVSESQSVARAIAAATEAGLEVVEVQEEALPVEFFDVGAVVYFLRKVIWTVPDFSSDKYREPLRRMHDQIEAAGSFTSHSRRFLIEARKPR